MYFWNWSCITDYGWKNSNLKLVKLEKNIYFNKVSLIRLHRIPNSSGHSRKYCVNKITILTNLRRQNTCPVVLYLVSLTSEKSHLGHLLKDILYFVWNVICSFAFYVPLLTHNVTRRKRKNAKKNFSIRLAYLQIIDFIF